VCLCECVCCVCQPWAPHRMCASTCGTNSKIYRNNQTNMIRLRAKMCSACMRARMRERAYIHTYIHRYTYIHIHGNIFTRISSSRPLIFYFFYFYHLAIMRTSQTRIFSSRPALTKKNQKKYSKSAQGEDTGKSPNIFFFFLLRICA
jgi:hypothetical protein